MSGCNSAVAGCHLGGAIVGWHGSHASLMIPHIAVGMKNKKRLLSGVYAGVVLWRSMKLRLDVRSPRLLMTTVSHWSWQMTDAFPSSLDLTSNGIFFENLECRFHPLYQEVLSFWSSIDRPSQNLVDSGSFLEFLVYNMPFWGFLTDRAESISLPAWRFARMHCDNLLHFSVGLLGHLRMNFIVRSCRREHGASSRR